MFQYMTPEFHFIKQRRFRILFCLHLAVRAIISSLRSEVRALIISSLKPIVKHQNNLKVGDGILI